MQFVALLALAALSHLACAAPCAAHSSSSSSSAVSVETVSATSSSAADIATSATTTTSSSSSSNDGTIGYASLNGGTTGGKGGTTTTVSSLAAFTEAVSGDSAAVVYVSGTITRSDSVRVGSNKSIIGLSSAAGLSGVGLYIKEVSNVIIQNMAISKVLADNNDAIGIQASTYVWIDHCDLSSDRDHDKDYYDGLCDITHASDFVTVSNAYFHDHWKASLLATAIAMAMRIPVTFVSRHIFNSYFDTQDTGVDTRDGAQVLVENNVFTGVQEPVASLYSDDPGYAVTNDGVFGEGSNTAPKGTLTSMSYAYSLLGSAAVKAAVVGTAGNTITMG